MPIDGYLVGALLANVTMPIGLNSWGTRLKELDEESYYPQALQFAEEVRDTSYLGRCVFHALQVKPGFLARVPSAKRLQELPII